MRGMASNLQSPGRGCGPRHLGDPAAAARGVSPGRARRPLLAQYPVDAARLHTRNRACGLDHHPALTGRARSTCRNPLVYKLLELKPPDVDLKADELRVRRQYTRGVRAEPDRERRPEHRFVAADAARSLERDDHARHVLASRARQRRRRCPGRRSGNVWATGSTMAAAETETSAEAPVSICFEW